MIVQMAGLPGTGKSTLAEALRTALGQSALLLDKDRVRHAIYGATHTDYTREQDDFVVGLLHRAAARHLDAADSNAVILDGRTCLRRYQIRQTLDLANSTGHQLHIVHCECAEATARRRLAADTAHPAANRTGELYTRLRESAEAITAPKVLINTDAAPEACLHQLMDYLRDNDRAPSRMERV
jgi:predicted kinase